MFDVEPPGEISNPNGNEIPEKTAKPDGVIDVAWSILEAGACKAAPAKRFGIGPNGAPVVTGKGMQPAGGEARRQAKRGTSGEILAELGAMLETMPSRKALILAPPPAG